MGNLVLLRDCFFYYKKGKFDIIVLIINGLVPYEKTKPLPFDHMKEAIYLFKAIQIKETPELVEKYCKILNGIRTSLQ